MITHLSDLIKLDDHLQTWFTQTQSKHEQPPSIQDKIEKEITVLFLHWQNWFPQQVDPKTRVPYQLEDDLRRALHHIFLKKPAHEEAKALIIKRRLLEAWNVRSLLKNQENS
jgi:hypothetical protein